MFQTCLMILKSEVLILEKAFFINVYISSHFYHHTPSLHFISSNFVFTIDFVHANSYFQYTVISSFIYFIFLLRAWISSSFLTGMSHVKGGGYLEKLDLPIFPSKHIQKKSKYYVKKHHTEALSWIIHWIIYILDNGVLMFHAIFYKELRLEKSAHI